MAKKVYWAGYCDGRLDETLEFHHENRVASIFLRKKDAKEQYQDVRKVEIREVKK